jgi:hypothetical protein
MTPEEAVTKLREAGLYVRDLKADRCISGGGWQEPIVDSIMGVKNAFVLILIGDEIYDVRVIADCQRDMKRHLSLEEAVAFLIKNVETSPLTHERAVVKLQEVGLYVRDLGEDGILGGSHVDRSGVIGMVQNGFLLKRIPSGEYEVDLEGGPKRNMDLDNAVALVILLVQPQPNIEGPPRRPGYQQY